MKVQLILRDVNLNSPVTLRKSMDTSWVMNGI